MEKSGGKTISLKSNSDLLDQEEVVTVSGTGDFAVGLTAEDQVFSCKTDNKRCQEICVPLFKLTIWPTEGVTLTPVNRDLVCTINNEEVISETNLVSGVQIEIGDKVIQYMEGPVPRPRRHLPPTPGVHVRATPPPKPTRNGMSPETRGEMPPAQKETESDWCHIEPPEMEEELINKLNTSDELSSLAAGCINKQIHEFTDTRMTTSLLDQVFRMLQDVGTHRRDILQNFLLEMARQSQATPETDKGRPLHAPIIHLLVEILKQFLDPVSHVALCLKLLRAFSHVPSNLATFIGCQATAAILGSMSVYVDEVEVQQNGIDILCKVATYTPSIDEKAPLRETAIELILRAMKHHTHSLFVTQSGCRTLASLCNMVFEQVNSIIDRERSSKQKLVQGVEKLAGLLDYMQLSATGVIHMAMKIFTSDLSVTMEGRRFLYVMARLEQLKQKQTLWLESNTGDESDDETSDGEPVDGILKKSRSYENLRSNERRVSFVDLQGPGVYDSTSDESTEGDTTERNLSPSNPNMEVDETVKERSGSDNSQAENGSCTTKNIVRGMNDGQENGDLKHVQNNGICDNGDVEVDDGDVEVGKGCRPDVVTSTFNGQDSQNGVSLFSELGQIDSGLVRSMGAGGEGKFGVGDDISEEEEEEVIDYSAADIQFLNRLVKTQIVCRVCSLAFMDEDKEAYTSIEKPVADMLKTGKLSAALHRFFLSKYKPELTMMDFDPNIVISLIDAVRYRSQVAPSVVQKTLLGVAKNIDKHVNQRHLKLGASILNKILDEPSLLLTVSDASFHIQCKAQLEESCQSLTDPSIFSSVLAKLTPGHSLMDLDCY
ncbi:LOW QUALITY PROTEIN: uncharacterized protein LOC124289041 [Haliotis rubra]|uniref:LOW QUALITY PROTEIN: uncharacterized protein LOC124289041 n=1 Tax=Haliotis rubra TaxID=36100 RepID=UPI001EE5E981|nr:LOW QUALITY PROTEIN: uncharacterized protein LOC124289041 [Haliotis rubra]